MKKGKGVLTRRIDENDISPERTAIKWVNSILGRANSAPDEPGLAGDSQRVEDEEGVVAQPVQDGGLIARECEGEVRVPDHLCHGPGQQHATISQASAQLWEQVRYSPNDGVAAEDLHEGREEGGADDACFFGGDEESVEVGEPIRGGKNGGRARYTRRQLHQI